MKHLLARSLAIGGLALGLAACDMDFLTDLDTENLNEPDLRRALTNAQDVESMIGSSWVPYWTYTQGTSSFNAPISAMAHEITSTVANWGVLELSAEPRTWAYNNHPAYGNRWLNQSPWYGLYGGLASTNDGLRAINDGMRMMDGDVDNTPRARAFGKYTQGLSLGMLALLFDKAIVATEETDLSDRKSLEYVPYTQVQAQAVQSLERAIEIAEQNSFVLPETWIQGLPLTSDQFVRVAHSHIARILAYTPRTPEERAAVDWNQVIFHLDRGIEEDHAPVLDRVGLNANYRRRTEMGRWFRIDYRTLGPADVSGRYQEWINAPVEERDWFMIETPDRRIAGDDRTTDPGTYFRYVTGKGVLNPSRGLYNWSHYQFRRWRNVRGGPSWREGPVVTMSMAEMDLLRAEAYYHLGRLGEAAELVNQTRTANGQLPPVTADGVPQDVDCVPQTTTGACGDLFDALMYEKHIETLGSMGPLAWFDRRGWGTLASGTVLHLPIPGRELETMGLASYTFGGGGEGSAQ